MKISKIEKQKKHKKRYSIFTNDEFCIGVYEDTVLKFGLRTGDELSEKKLTELKDYDEIIAGKKIAYEFLSYRQRSKKEIAKKLKQKKISEKNIDAIISQLKEQKYIDDEKFARNFLDSKIRQKPAGKRLLKLKLIEKGIDEETAERAIDENFPEAKEIESAKKLLAKFQKKHKGEEGIKLKSKSYRYLASKGFDTEIINEVLKISG